MCTSNSLPAIPFLETFSSGDCVQCTLKSGPRNPLPTSQHFRQRKQVAIFCTYPPTFAFSAKEGKLPAPRSWVLGGSWWKAVQRQIMVDCVWCFDSVFGTTYTHTQLGRCYCYTSTPLSLPVGRARWRVWCHILRHLCYPGSRQLDGEHITALWIIAAIGIVVLCYLEIELYYTFEAVIGNDKLPMSFACL